ncbi:hypothetical protein [Mycobacterium canetti]|nr:hypothetical protein [Mycobacterium canetti]
MAEVELGKVVTVQSLTRIARSGEVFPWEAQSWWVANTGSRTTA